MLRTRYRLKGLLRLIIFKVHTRGLCALWFWLQAAALFVPATDFGVLEQPAGRSSGARPWRSLLRHWRSLVREQMITGAGVASSVFVKVFRPTARVSVSPGKFCGCSDQQCCPSFPLQSFQVPVWSSALEAGPVILRASFRKGSVRRCAEVFDPTSSAGAPIDRAAPVFRCSHFGLWLVQSVGSKAGVAPRVVSKMFRPTVCVSVWPEKCPLVLRSTVLPQLSAAVMKGFWLVQCVGSMAGFVPDLFLKCSARRCA